MYRLSALPYIIPMLSALMLFVTVKTQKSKILLCIVTVVSSVIILLSVTAVIDSFSGVKQTETQIVFDESNSSNHSANTRKYFFTRRPASVLRGSNGEKYYVIGDVDRNPTSQFVKTDVRITYLPKTKLIIAIDEVKTNYGLGQYSIGNSMKEKGYYNIYHMDSELGWICILIILFIIVFGSNSTDEKTKNKEKNKY
ncbi:MAG: hypothetical protein IKU43_00975 [Clostridia bacterium]|nr:hypothetical protein [Clostridia bacterium]